MEETKTGTDSTDIHKSVGPETAHVEGFLTVEEVCGLLKRKSTWVYRQTSKGTIPVCRAGKYLLFERSKLIAWVRENGTRRNGRGRRGSR